MKNENWQKVNEKQLYFCSYFDLFLRNVLYVLCLKIVLNFIYGYSFKLYPTYGYLWVLNYLKIIY